MPATSIFFGIVIRIFYRKGSIVSNGLPTFMRRQLARISASCCLAHCLNR
jgi:hypothetical protein